MALKPGLAVWSDQNSDLNRILRLAVIAVCTLAASACTNLEGFSVPSPAKQTLALASALPNAIVGKTYTVGLPVTAGRPPYFFSLSQGSLPAGLALNPRTGSITGIPSQAGSSDFTVSVTANPISSSESHAYSVHVDPCDSCTKVTISPISPTGPAGGKIQFTATVTGTSQTAVTWSASAGNISTTGLFTAPMAASGQTITVSASSSAQPSVRASSTVRITGAIAPLKIDTSGIPAATIGEPYSTSLAAIGGSAPYKWKIATGSLPSGLQFDSNTGAITGSTVQSGTFTFTAQVTDGTAHTAQQGYALAVSASQLCGPPTYRCSRTDVSLAQAPRLVPNVGNLAGSNRIVVDPDFRNRIVRVTDWNTDPGLPPSGRTFVSAASASSNENVWNVDSTLFTVQNNGASTYPFTFDPSSLKAARMYVSSYPSTGGLRLSDGSTWSRRNPNVLYTYSGTTVSEYDFSDRVNPPSPHLVYDFTSSNRCLPKGFNATWHSRGGVSAGDTLFGMAYSNAGAQGTGVYVVAYKPGSGCTMLNTMTGQVSGDWGATGTISIPDRWTIHAVKVSRDGNWFMVAPQHCALSACMVGPYFWEIGTTNVTACAKGEQCSGHSTEGYSHWMNNNNTAYHSLRSFAEPATVRQLNNLVPNGIAAPLDEHPSWNNADPADTYPFFVSTWSPLTPFPAPWYDEIMGVAADGSGKVWRFAHSFITGRSQSFATKYGIGSVSQDGRFFLFSSDWMGALGSQSQAATCTVAKDCRGDVFVVELQ